MRRYLVLEDGKVFSGVGFGGEQDVIGEVVFHTAMTGYQEIITDPTNYGQIVVMTYPLIGNYGINRDDFESLIPGLFGLIVKEVSECPSNFRSDMALGDFLTGKGIAGLSGFDTRALTKHLRTHGVMRGAITSDIEKAKQLLKNTPLLTNHVAHVSTSNPYPSPGRGYKVVLVDFGMKHGLLRELNKRHCDIIVVPYTISVADVLALKPDGVLLSNGPGNPKELSGAIENIRKIQASLPIFGIGLGHQLICLANGADTEKMKVGHRSSSVPVKELRSGRVHMTTQNHGYVVNKASLKETDLDLTYEAVNDGTVEGVRHRMYPVFSVQFHPEASPGSEDTNGLFDAFIACIDDMRKGGDRDA